MKNILSDLSKAEKNRILEMHKRATRKNYLNENERVIVSDGPTKFFPSDMKNKTINLYEDPGKTVFDQQYLIINYEYTNHGKRVTFELDKNPPMGYRTATMSFDCVKPNYFTYSMTDERNSKQNITNEMRYNSVTEKLKTEYCPSVLNVKPDKNYPADFASNVTGGGSGEQVS